jgi:hypothetical protein
MAADGKWEGESWQVSVSRGRGEGHTSDFTCERAEECRWLRAADFQGIVTGIGDGRKVGGDGKWEELLLNN